MSKKLNTELEELSKVNLRKDGKPRAKADPGALARIAEIREQLQNEEDKKEDNGLEFEHISSVPKEHVLNVQGKRVVRTV